MSSGFITYVDGASVVQIDSSYSSMVEVARGSNAPPYTSITYVGGGDRSNLVFVRPPNGYPVAAWGPAPGGQGGQGIWPAGEYFLVNMEGVNVFFDYVVYAHSVYAREAPASGTGLLITDPDGKPRYFSGWNYLNVAANLIAPPTSLTWDFYLPSPRSGFRYYACINNLWITSINIDEEYGYFVEFVSETHVRVHTRRLASFSSVELGVYNPPLWYTPSILIAEVPT